MAAIGLQKPQLLAEVELVENGKGFTGAITGAEDFAANDIVTFNGTTWAKTAALAVANLALVKEPAVDQYHRPDTTEQPSTSRLKKSVSLVNLRNRARVIMSTSPSVALLAGHIGTTVALGYDAPSGCHFATNGTTTTPSFYIESVLTNDIISKNAGGVSSTVAGQWGALGDTGVRVIGYFIESAAY